MQGEWPSPQSKSECFSETFITKVKTFIADKYGFFEDTYANDECDYNELLQNISKLKAITYNLINLLKNKNVTVAKFNQVFSTYTSARDSYSLGIRNFILNNDKSCYYNARQSRQFPLFLTDAIYSVLVKCLQYTEKSEYQHLCS